MTSIRSDYFGPRLSGNFMNPNETAEEAEKRLEQAISFARSAYPPSTSLKFKSLNDKRYMICHVPKLHQGPFLHLCGYDKDREDFIKVARQVLKITNGRPEDVGDNLLERFVLDVTLDIKRPFFDKLLGKFLNIMERENDIIALIDVPQGFTQLKLYNFVQGYRTCFKELEFDKKLKEIVNEYDCQEHRPKTVLISVDQDLVDYAERRARETLALNSASK